ncbi:MAG: hypothetical protein KKF68_02110 [Nanoarchaeota archaeon]|nr:hypothetical protein [Nanoarchaeota archaeon]
MSQDPSKDPKLTSHYVGHALLIARFGVETENRDKINGARERLIFQLKNMEFCDSSYSALARNCIDYLNQFGEWNSSRDVETFAEEYGRLESETVGANPVKEFLEARSK